MDLLALWQSKHDLGRIRFDADVVVIKPTGINAEPAWGTVFYSAAREEYKSKLKVAEGSPSFDLELMETLKLTEFKELTIAANPNSLFRGHLVIYPRQKSARLKLADLSSITELAAEQPAFTFIHNMENSAASIIDWAHFQAYYARLPIHDEPFDLIKKSGGGAIMRTGDDFPAYALAVDGFSANVISNWLLATLEMLLDEGGPNGQPVPCNIIWQGTRVSVIPRSIHQTPLAASYFGGLEMGGLLWATTPNAKSVSFILLGLRWTILSPPEHTQLYSTKGLRYLLKESGFSNIRMLTSGLNPIEIVHSYRKRLLGNRSEGSFDRVNAGYSLNEGLTRTPLRRAVKSSLNGVLNFTGLGDSLKIFAQR